MTRDPDDDLSWHIVTAVAEERGVEPLDIDERLYDVIDVEALERIARQAEDSGEVDLSVSFRLAGCFVTVTNGTTVRARSPG